MIQAADIIDEIGVRFNKDFKFDHPSASPRTTIELPEAGLGWDGEEPLQTTEVEYNQKINGLPLPDYIKTDEEKKRWEDIGRRFENSRIDLTKPIPNLEPLIYFDDIPICTKRNCSFVSGDAGTCKSTLIAALVVAYLNGETGNQRFKGSDDERKFVLWIDTEQNTEDCALIKQRINRGVGLPENQNNPQFEIVGLDDAESVKEMWEATEDYIYYCNPTFIVIDGIVDYSESGGNDPAEAKEAIFKIRQWAKKYNAHLMTVIHTNRGTEKARGHWGGESHRKFETVLYNERDDEDSDLIICKFNKTRRERPAQFAFKWSSENYLIEMCDYPNNAKYGDRTIKKNNSSTTDKPIQICSTAFGKDETLQRKVLVDRLCHNQGWNEKTAKNKIIDYKKKLNLLTEDEQKMIRFVGREAQ